MALRTHGTSVPGPGEDTRQTSCDGACRDFRITHHFNFLAAVSPPLIFIFHATAIDADSRRIAGNVVNGASMRLARP
jgi:hypothetical protein